MTEKVMEQLKQLDSKNDPVLMEKVSNAKSTAELVEILAEQGIHVTEEELCVKPSVGKGLAAHQLDDNDLDNVAGGANFQTEVISHITSEFASGLNIGLGGSCTKGDCFSYNLGVRLGYLTYNRKQKFKG